MCFLSGDSIFWPQRSIRIFSEIKSKIGGQFWPGERFRKQKDFKDTCELWATQESYRALMSKSEIPQDHSNVEITFAFDHRLACVAWRFCRAGRRSGVAAKFAREFKLLLPQSPRGFSALARLSYLARPTKTVMPRRLITDKYFLTFSSQ